MNYQKKAFSLLEILLSLSLISVLTIIIYSYISPTSILKQSNNTINKSNVLKIYTALEQYTLQNDIPLTSLQNLPNNSITEICADSEISCTGLIDLSILKPKYIKEIPSDPNQKDGTNYFIIKDVNGEIGIGGLNPLDDSTFVEGLSEQTFIKP